MVWSLEAAHRRTCKTLTNTMPSAVRVAGAAFTDLPHKRFSVRPNVRAKRHSTAWRDGQVGQNGAKPQPGLDGVPSRWVSA